MSPENNLSEYAANQCSNYDCIAFPDLTDIASGTDLLSGETVPGNGRLRFVAKNDSTDKDCRFTVFWIETTPRRRKPVAKYFKCDPANFWHYNA